MGTTFNPQTVQSGFRDEQLINDILADIQRDLEDKVDRNGVSPNAMDADLDIGSNRLLNVAQGTIGTDGVNLNQVTNIATALLGGGGVNSTSSNPLTFNYGVASGSQGTSNRTVFDLNALFGVTSLDGVTAIVNGVVQIPGQAYSFSGTTVTFTESVNADSDILFIYGDLSPTPTVSQTVNNYDIAIFVEGQPTDSQEILRLVAVRDIIYQDDFANSRLDAETAADSEAVFTVKVDGSSVGTITVAASGTTGTFATTGTGTLTVNAGEVLTIEAPSSQDSTLADISITLFGSRSS